MIALRSTPSPVVRRSSVASVARPRVAVRSAPKDVDAKLQQALADAKACDEKSDVSW